MTVYPSHFPTLALHCGEAGRRRLGGDGVRIPLGSTHRRSRQQSPLICAVVMRLSQYGVQVVDAQEHHVPPVFRSNCLRLRTVPERASFAFSRGLLDHPLVDAVKDLGVRHDPVALGASLAGDPRADDS